MADRTASLLLNSLTLVQFKNYRQQSFAFDNKIIAITGPNGRGKTNLLDSIYYLCFTKSYFSGQEIQNVQYQTNGFRLEGIFHKQEKTEEIVCRVKDDKKEFLLNKEAYAKFSLHIGHFPAVMIAPDDAIIITGGSEYRRKFIDTLLSQLSAEYLAHLIAYNKVLQQRNSLLKSCPHPKALNIPLLEIFDGQLADHGEHIFTARKTFLDQYTARVQEFYDYIAGNHEVVDIHYQSTFPEQDFRDQLRLQRDKDLMLQRTTTGVHRDDLRFLLESHPLKTSGSQGQRKSFLFALKLAQYKVIGEQKGFTPLLLLDDLFEKLDQERISRLVQLVNGPDFGQVFITDTHVERVKHAFAENTDQLQLIEL